MMRDINKRAQLQAARISRRLPRTLSTFQISMVTGIVVLLVLRSTVGGFGHSSSADYWAERAKNNEPKRNLAQIARLDVGDPQYRLGPLISDWDEQRASWLAQHPKKRYTSEGKPRVLLVTGSTPWPCIKERGDYFYLKSIKNKLDYARIHEYEIFYNFAFLDDAFNSLWAKLPLIRKLMLTHPEVEWIFWVDADAVITDMVFELPLEKYDQYNIVMWGWDSGVYEEKNWVAMNTGVFFIRNCQWSLDLLDMWLPMGPEGNIRNEAGKFLTKVLTQGPGQKRPEMPADDQSALVYLLNTKEELRPKILLENRKFILSGYFNNIVDHLEEYMEKHHPGLGDDRWPFTTHFTGCQPCEGRGNPVYSRDRCTVQFERAFNFADNQVMRLMGFQHKCLECVDLKRVKNETTRPVDSLHTDNTWMPSSKSMKFAY